jgi:hypothetical protein
MQPLPAPPRASANPARAARVTRGAASRGGGGGGYAAAGAGAGAGGSLSKHRQRGKWAGTAVAMQVGLYKLSSADP